MWALMLWSTLAHAGDVQSRTTVGAVGESAQSVHRVGLEWLLGETLQVDAVSNDDLSVTFDLAGRLGVNAFNGHLQRARLRALSATVKTGAWAIRAGRVSPEGGGWRLVDGVEVLRTVSPGLRVGGWAGLGASVANSAPAARFGLGPSVIWEADHASASFLGDIQVAPQGFDRAAGVFQGHVELGRTAEFVGILDVQTGDKTALSLSDLTVLGRFDPADNLRVDVSYDAWSGLVYKATGTRDPLVTRFSLRSQALDGDNWTPQDRVDPTLTHQLLGKARWRIPLAIASLDLTAKAQARLHRFADRRYLRIGGEAKLAGLLGGRLDAGVGESFLYWQGHPAGVTTGSVFLQLDDAGRFALDGSAELAFRASSVA